MNGGSDAIFCSKVYLSRMLKQMISFDLEHYSLGWFFVMRVSEGAYWFISIEQKRESPEHEKSWSLLTNQFYFWLLKCTTKPI